MTALLDEVLELYSIAQTGLAFAKDKYDLDRYRRLVELFARMQAHLTDTDEATVKNTIALEKGYPTPKVDVRAAVVQDGKILLVRETDGQAWSLPGGWADIGYSPAEVAVKEVKEESGCDVRVCKLIAVQDRSRHGHPPFFWYVYRLFFLCELVGMGEGDGLETDGREFFSPDALPELSLHRITPKQIRMCLRHHVDPSLPTEFD